MFLTVLGQIDPVIELFEPVIYDRFPSAFLQSRCSSSNGPTVRRAVKILHIPFADTPGKDLRLAPALGCYSIILIIRFGMSYEYYPHLPCRPSLRYGYTGDLITVLIPFEPDIISSKCIEIRDPFINNELGSRI